MVMHPLTVSAPDTSSNDLPIVTSLQTKSSVPWWDRVWSMRTRAIRSKGAVGTRTVRTSCPSNQASMYQKISSVDLGKELAGECGTVVQSSSRNTAVCRPIVSKERKSYATSTGPKVSAEHKQDITQAGRGTRGTHANVTRTMPSCTDDLTSMQQLQMRPRQRSGNHVKDTFNRGVNDFHYRQPCHPMDWCFITSLDGMLEVCPCSRSGPCC